MHRFTVENKHKGKVYTADATIEKGMLTVSHPTIGSKSASCSSIASGKPLAVILLGELIRNHQGGGW